MADQKDLAYKDYQHGMKYKDIADKYGVTINTVKSWKTRYNWSRDGVHTKEKSVHTKKKDASKKKQPIEPVIESDELTEKQWLFCLYYVKYFNATKAYQKAYETNYVTANKNAYALMVKHGIKKEIERLKKEVSQGLMLDATFVLQKYIDIAFADITDFVEFGREEVTDDLGNPYEVNRVKFKTSSEVDGTIITEIKQGKDGVSVKLADKMKALEFLSKYTDILSENDKKRLQEEKLKAEIDNLKGSGDSDDDLIDEWVEAVTEDEE